jgi:hypothetical protein
MSRLATAKRHRDRSAMVTLVGFMLYLQWFWPLTTTRG